MFEFFFQFAQQKADSTSRIKYLCKKYVNMVYHYISLVEEHLLYYGMDKKYTRWIWHGEGDPNEVVHDDDDRHSPPKKLSRVKVLE